MDGQVMSQEETEAMFSKITSIIDYLRNQLVNNTELAKQVQALTAQVDQLTGQINSVVGQNTALQEAVNVITQERDQAREYASKLEHDGRELRLQFETRDNDANHWYAEFQRVTAEMEQVKAEYTELRENHLKLMDEHKEVQEKLGRIQSVFAREMATVEEIKAREPQPRDPLTQQWRSPYDSERQVG